MSDVGDGGAASMPGEAVQLFARVYDQLRGVARAALLAEHAGHTLQPTALVHEAYLRLCGQRAAHWKGPEHFLAVASTAIRRILIDHARARATIKRGLGRRPGAIREDGPSDEGEWRRWVDLDEALQRLAALDPRQGRVVELKVFGGLTNEQIAGVLEVSRATVANDWTAARAWISREVMGCGS